MFRKLAIVGATMVTGASGALAHPGHGGEGFAAHVAEFTALAMIAAVLAGVFYMRRRGARIR